MGEHCAPGPQHPGIRCLYHTPLTSCSASRLKKPTDFGAVTALPSKLLRILESALAGRSVHINIEGVELELPRRARETPGHLARAKRQHIVLAPEKGLQYCSGPNYEVYYAKLVADKHYIIVNRFQRCAVCCLCSQRERERKKERERHFTYFSHMSNFKVFA